MNAALRLSCQFLGARGGNSVQFTEFIQNNLHLYQFRNNMPLSTAAAANFARGELATALRKAGTWEEKNLNSWANDRSNWCLEEGTTISDKYGSARSELVGELNSMPCTDVAYEGLGIQASHMVSMQRWLDCIPGQ
ncbi:probable proteasome subunit beta type-2 isoform X2 [Hordeum vulgare subsp. vulgare]|uniref:probable proteasome subunit beta type-2 isoform X2 n=1 Tax=Hordeum vulgare subsp. vulgare TaxID=112509 RepID=UPI001D1A4AE3|nr:probable proteasome subunit beta type-2 isoform X2 [Hordeum vulgare subsp. vulgare]